MLFISHNLNVVRKLCTRTAVMQRGVLVEEGDIISIDIPACKIELQVDEATLAARRAKWICPEPKIKTGYLARYAKLVTSAARGAVLE